MKKTISSILTISIVLGTLLWAPLCTAKVYATGKDYYVSGITYDFGDDGNYDIENDESTIVNSSLAKIQVIGDINGTSTYNGVQAYGLKSGNMTFRLVYDGACLDEGGTRYLLDDSGKKAFGQKFDAKIKKGIMVVQKSEDGLTWENILSPVMNVFADNPNGMNIFYKTNGADVKKGCYYRILYAYESRTMLDSTKILLWDKKNYEDHKYVEEYIFYVCLNSAEITLNNLSVKDEELVVDEDGYSLEILKKGNNLLDESATKDGFKIDTNGANYSVKVNNETASNGKTYRKDGKYTITTTSVLGAKTSKTVYVFSGGEDSGFSYYFDEFIVSGKRVFREGEYPTYAAGSSAVIKAIPDGIPNISGTITNLISGEEITVNANTRKQRSYKLKAGTYCAELYTGNGDCGSVFHYTFIFNIIDEESKPYVNYNTLMSLDRLSDLSSKNYQVVYQTTGGGYIYACFNSYDEAFAYAYDIEKRFIEWSDGELYYKSLENSNVKEKYQLNTSEDKIKLTKALNMYARQNVEIGYINPLEEFTYQPIAENERDLLKCLETLSLRQSIKVFSSQDEKEKAFLRAPYLNEHTLVHVDDYDVKSVIAKCKADGKEYPLRFNIPIENQLKVSSVYTIVETNQYGDDLSYDAVFMGDNQTISNWEIVADGYKQTKTLSVENFENITADSMTLKSIKNELDESAIISIKAPNIYSYDLTGLNSELVGLTLYKEGDYTISFIDRVGNSYSINVHITGDVKYSDAIIGNNKSYTEIYNEIHLNDKDGSEEKK